MENNSVEKKVKPTKSNSYSSLRIKKELKKRIMSDLSKVNKKDFGKKVHIGEYLDLIMGLFSSDHISHLQESSLSNADRFERDYRNYIAEHGHILKDVYLGLRLNGEEKNSATGTDKDRSK